MAADTVVAILGSILYLLGFPIVWSMKSGGPAWRTSRILLMICVGMAFAYFLQAVSLDPAVKAYWYKTTLTGMIAAPVALLYFALMLDTFPPVWIAATRILAGVIPLAAAVLIFTNDLHGWLWDPTQTTRIASALQWMSVQAARTGYWVLAVYVFIVLALALFLLLRLLFRSPGVRQSQTFAIAAIVVLAMSGMATDLTGVSPFPPFAATALSLAFCILPMGFLLAPLRSRALVAISRRMLIDGIGDCVFVMDASHRILEMNAAAEALAGLTVQAAQGRRMSEILPGLHYLPDSDGEGEAEVTWQSRDFVRLFNQHVTPIHDSQNRTAGMVIQLTDITERRRVQSDRDVDLEAERRFLGQLTCLATLTNELSKAPTQDDLCRRAVEAGRELLGFDRMALWFITEDCQCMLGTYGTDETGRTTDERSARLAIPIQSRLQAIVTGRLRLQYYEDAPLLEQHGRRVGTGQRVLVGLWDGEKVIGFLSIDNLIRKRKFSSQDRELLGLYGAALGHLCTLKRAQEELEQIAGHLERRVEERTAELEAANRELEAFAYSVSHDLRAPLRAIDGFARILTEDFADSLGAEGRRLCATIQHRTRLMDKLIDDLLSFSRFSRTEIQKQRIDMTHLVESVFQELTAIRDRRKITWQLDDLPSAEGDPALIRQVWINLLSNAIKFTGIRKRPVIHVSAEKAEREMIYCVRDNGAGFNMDYASRLFSVFQRLHTDSEFPGTGIGLAIVQRIIHRHSGRVWAEGAEQKGAAFFFSLPREIEEPESSS